jgi:hypothetical protein
MITTPQIYYHAVTGHRLDFDNTHETCRVCGGAAIPPPPGIVLEKRNWDSWTDEALCRDPGSDTICAACIYVLERNIPRVREKRTGIWENTTVLGASLGKIMKYEKYDGLLDVLDEKLSPPYFIMIRGNTSDTKKHIFLRCLGAENYSDSGEVCISYYDILFKAKNASESMRIGSGAGTVHVQPDKFRHDALSLAAMLMPHFLEVRKKGKIKSVAFWLAIYSTTSGFNISEFRRQMQSSPYLRLLAAVASEVVQKEVDLVP